MPEIKTFYNVNNLTIQELNLVLNQIADRIDKLEGRRGTPEFYAAVNMRQNKITAATQGTASGEVLTADMADDSLSVSSSGLAVKLAALSGLAIDSGLKVVSDPSGSIIIDEDGLDVSLESFFPVGIIVVTTTNTNPADLGYPGTWEAV